VEEVSAGRDSDASIGLAFLSKHDETKHIWRSKGVTKSKLTGFVSHDTIKQGSECRIDPPKRSFKTEVLRSSFDEGDQNVSQMSRLDQDLGSDPF